MTQQARRMPVDNTEWRELMTISMDFSDVEYALNSKRTDDAVELMRPMEVVLKKHNQQTALRTLRKMLAYAQRGQWRAALTNARQFQHEIEQAIQGSYGKKGKIVWESVVAKRQVSPKFKRELEAEIRRLTEQS